MDMDIRDNTQVPCAADHDVPDFGDGRKPFFGAHIGRETMAGKTEKFTRKWCGHEIQNRGEGGHDPS